MRLLLGLLILFTFSVQANEARFAWFEYEGKDSAYQQKLDDKHYYNPIIAGYYPDPSIVRVEEDYYLVNSSFAYFPGLPVFHSRDLVNWTQIGNALNRRSQLTFEKGQRISRGIFAPTIRFYKGVFYIITTDVDGIGNFYITAENPAGPWSEPVQLPDIGGIDPDLFFDDDGKVYIAHNDAPEGEPLYDGHRAIWLWEYDLANNKVIKESGRVIVNGGVDISKKPVWIEGPHIYKVNGWYYLSCAEGGTSLNHSQVVLRTKSLTEPFVPYKGNPILTQRDLPADRPNPVTSVGHADFVQTPAGDWWAIFLGIRPYFDREKNDWYHNTGRETFLLPVEWNEWPTILAEDKAVPIQVRKPNLPQKKSERATAGNFIWRDNFDQKEKDLAWISARSSAVNWHQIDTKNRQLVFNPLPIRLDELKQPAYLGKRQQHLQFRARLNVLKPASEKVSSGFAIFHTAQHHYFLAVHSTGELVLEETLKGNHRVLAKTRVNEKQEEIVLGVEQIKDTLRFFYLNHSQQEVTLIENIPARNLSTQEAGGFVGVTMGPHARLNK